MWLCKYKYIYIYSYIYQRCRARVDQYWGSASLHIQRVVMVVQRDLDLHKITKFKIVFGLDQNAKLAVHLGGEKV